MLQDLTKWVSDVVESLGYVGVALLVALENVLPPIPSEVVLGLAGYVASHGDASLWGMIVAATIGSVVGAWVTYGLAAAIGPDRVRVGVVRCGGWIGFGAEDLDRAEAWFDKRSKVAVLVCRCIPLLRSLISVPAGFRRMELGAFTAATLIGSTVWNTTLITAGYLLGEQWDRMLEYTESFQSVVLVVIAVVVAVVVARRVRLARAARDDVSDPGEVPDPESPLADRVSDAADQ